jgi:hypothetical protein
VCPDVVGVGVGYIAVTAHKGSVQHRVDMFLPLFLAPDCLEAMHALLILDDGEVFLGSWVQTHPD